MKAYDFINSNIGSKVYITRTGDLAMSSGLRGYIFNKTEMTIVRLSKKGMAVLKDSEGNEVHVPPRNVREIGH